MSNTTELIKKFIDRLGYSHHVEEIDAELPGHFYSAVIYVDHLTRAGSGIGNTPEEAIVNAFNAILYIEMKILKMAENSKEKSRWKQSQE